MLSGVRRRGGEIVESEPGRRGCGRQNGAVGGSAPSVSLTRLACADGRPRLALAEQPSPSRPPSITIF